jgi:hypothetical protein
MVTKVTMGLYLAVFVLWAQNLFFTTDGNNNNRQADIYDQIKKEH